MSLAQLKHHVAALSPKEQRQLIAYIISQQTARDALFKTRLAQKIDDADPAHWIELDELKRRSFE